MRAGLTSAVKHKNALIPKCCQPSPQQPNRHTQSAKRNPAAPAAMYSTTLIPKCSSVIECSPPTAPPSNAASSPNGTLTSQSTEPSTPSSRAYSWEGRGGALALACGGRWAWPPLSLGVHPRPELCGKRKGEPTTSHHSGSLPGHDGKTASQLLLASHLQLGEQLLVVRPPHAADHLEPRHAHRAPRVVRARWGARGRDGARGEGGKVGVESGVGL